MNGLPDSWLQPAWSGAPVLAGTTSREGGCSGPPWTGLNVRLGEDRTADVLTNRATLATLLGGGTLQFLSQVHGNAVLHATTSTAATVPDADAMWTAEADLCLVIQTADCLPVLATTRDGQVVGAAHAGWRGLALGVIPALLNALPCSPRDLSIWLGPCISLGPSYEVGEEVRDAFANATSPPDLERAFRPGNLPGKWWCDLLVLARAQLLMLGVSADQISDSGTGTLTDSSLYSYRRDGVTGRMASFIVRRRVIRDGIDLPSL